MLCTWLGLTLSYLIPTVPPSSAIIAAASAVYLIAFLLISGPAGRLVAARPPVIGKTEN